VLFFTAVHLVMMVLLLLLLLNTFPRHLALLSSRSYSDILPLLLLLLQYATTVARE
jgi:hypothetical protein